MKIDNELKIKIITILKDQWILFTIAGCVLLLGLVMLLIPKSGNTKNEITPDGGEKKSENNNKKPFNLFGLFPDEEKKESSPTNTNVFPTPHIGVNVKGDNLSVTSIGQGGVLNPKTVTGNTTIKTNQGTISTNTNIQTDVQSNTSEDRIRIVFQNPDGTTTTYVPPGTPPDEVRWGRYTNEKSRYGINFPSNWQLFYSIDEDGNEGIALYPPGVNRGDQSAPFIGFGITDEIRLPAVGTDTDVFITPLTVDGVSGNLYTNGPFGNSYIASVLDYNSKHFGLGSSRSTTTFAYVYYYMLNSLTLNTD